MKKRWFVFIIAFFFCVGLNGVGEKAYAVSTPYAVIGTDVWMLNESGNKLFLLPETYYAKIERMDENYYYISFNGVSGKIPKGSVSVVGYDKQVKDTQKIIRVADAYAVFTEIKLKTALEGENTGEFAVPTTEPLTYVGTYKQGDAVWYYVSYAGNYGYILNTYTDSPNMTTERFVPEREASIEEEREEERSEEEGPKNDLVKILIIGGVSAVVLVLIIILFLPRKSKKHKYYYS